MRPTCLIFDVDGTLVDSTGTDDTLYKAAIRSVLGDVSLRGAWSEYEHVTDAGLFREICSDNGLVVTELAPRMRQRFGELMTVQLATPGRCNPLPGAVEVWNRVRIDRRFRVGIATGGWGHTARMKLDSAGFNRDGVVLACSDDSHERTRIMEHCHASLGSAGTPVYFGDGEWDLAAASRLGWRFVGVGKRLEGKCAEWLPDLRSIDLLSLIQSDSADSA